MNVHERSRTVREQAICSWTGDLENKIRKLSNKQTNKHCSWTVHEQIYEQQTLDIASRSTLPGVRDADLCSGQVTQVPRVRGGMAPFSKRPSATD